MTKKQAIQLFQERKVRTVWDDVQEKWYFSIVDVCGVLTDSKDYLTARKYWNKLKQRLKDEGNETVTNCHQLKMKAADGKMRMTDVADQEQLFRLIQSIPSPKAEPFKQWMAQVASQRIDQMQDPELNIDQAIQRTEKREPARQHDQFGNCPQYLGRSLSHGTFQAARPKRFQCSDPSGKGWRKCGKGRSKPVGKQAGTFHHIQCQSQRLSAVG